LALIVLLFLSLLGYYFYSKPTYEGEQKLKNIQNETTVYFDDFGVPHIYANSQKEAMITLGYVHAQDRRLSEMFGSKLLKTDQFFAGLGIDENSEKAIAKLEKNTEAYQLAMAYIDGINQ